MRERLFGKLSILLLLVLIVYVILRSIQEGGRGAVEGISVIIGLVIIFYIHSYNAEISDRLLSQDDVSVSASVVEGASEHSVQVQRGSDTEKQTIDAT